MLSVALLGTACGYSGAPGAGGGALDRVVDLPDDEPMLTSIQVRWGAASGPVAGYLVLLDRDGAGFEAHIEVTDPVVTIEGEPGHTVRVAVAAFDADGNFGPNSPISDTILFQVNGAMALSEPAQTQAVATTRSTLPAGETGGAAQSASAADAGADAAVAAARFDFDGDATAELLWESPELGFFRLTTFEGETLALFGRAGAGWERAGLADLDADGVSDVLWSGAAGELAFTSTAESLVTVPTVRLVTLGSLHPDERVAATGDFDGDGRSDVVVVDEARGEFAVWITRAGAASQVIPLPAVAAGWNVGETGDFDGDGRADLIWTTPDGHTLWAMDGAQVRDELELGESVEALASGDFDGDGVEDIARRGAFGAVTISLMGAEKVWAKLPLTEPDWLAAGAGDFDGDGLADLLWERDGAVEIWFSEGDGRIEPVAVAALGPEWSLVPSGS